MKTRTGEARTSGERTMIGVAATMVAAAKITEPPVTSNLTKRFEKITYVRGLVMFPPCRLLSYASSIFGLSNARPYWMKNDQIPSSTIKSTLSTRLGSFDACYLCSKEHLRYDEPSRK